MGGNHAKKSPSGSKIWHGCAGALAMAAILPEEMQNTGGPAAQRGTAAHLLLETSLRELTPPEAYEGRIIELRYLRNGDEEAVMLKPRAKAPKGGTAVWFEVDEEMIGNVNLAYEYVEHLCEELGVPMSSVQLETRTNPVPERDDTAGTADITIDAWPLWLVVVDFKNGRITVEHADNPQLLAYLAGKAHDTGWLHDYYKIAVVQPNGRHEEGRVRPFEISKADLLAFVDLHRAKAEAADEASDAFADVDYDVNGILDPEAEIPETFASRYLTAGEHCEWCPAALVCPAYKTYARDVARTDFADAPPVEEAGLYVQAVAEAVLIRKAEPFIKALLRKASALLNAEARAGRMPADLKYIRSQTNRAWITGEDGKPLPTGDLLTMLLKSGYFPDEKFPKLIPPQAVISGPAAEKLVSAKDGLRKKFAAEFLAKPEGALKLVGRNAPGEEVVVTVADDFKDIEEDENEDY